METTYIKNVAVFYGEGGGGVLIGRHEGEVYLDAGNLSNARSRRGA